MWLAIKEEESMEGEVGTALVAIMFSFIILPAAWIGMALKPKKNKKDLDDMWNAFWASFPIKILEKIGILGEDEECQNQETE